MKAKLIFFILIIALACGFIFVNYNNTCTVSFGFKLYESVPVFLVVFISLAIGVFVMLPFTFGKKATKKEKVKAGKVKETQEVQEVPVNQNNPSDDKQKINL
jgi:dolichyl-phosphate-mannose--protein O-mannosyl transferase